MELEGSLPHSQELVTCSYPEPNRFSPYPHPTFQRSILILSSQVCLDLPSVFLPSRFPTETLYATFLSHIRATCPTNLNLLLLITQIIFVRGTLHKAPHCVVFPIPLLPRHVPTIIQNGLPGEVHSSTVAELWLTACAIARPFVLVRASSVSFELPF